MQNLLVTRFANTFLEPLWNSRWVDHVQITVAESIGVGARGGYYDQSGALRDMVQNHLLQLLCLVAMEPPTYIGREAVRDEKLKVLQALQPMAPADVDRDTVRGRYGVGLVDGAARPVVRRGAGARRQLDRDLRGAEAEVQNWRWAGVPFYLRTGKRMDRRTSEIVVVFKEPPHAMFPHSEGSRAQQPAHPGAARRGHAPAPDREGARPRRLPAAPGVARPQLRHDVRPGLTRRLRAAAHGRDAGQPHACSCAATRSRPRGPGSSRSSPVGNVARPAQALRRRHAGPNAAATLIERDGRTWQESDQ